MLKTKSRFFPNPLLSQKDGLVAISEELTVDILLEAYGKGIFPWPYEESPILWFSPDPRGILYFEKFHVSKKLKKFMKNCEWVIKWNTHFSEVIYECAEAKRKGEKGTWITEHLIQNYKLLHKAGYAHSVEVWEDETLIGGLYGVYVEGSFSGESMFFKKSNASKVALWVLIEELKRMGLKWLDIQMVSPLLKFMGGEYIDRIAFYKELKAAQENQALFKPLSPRCATVRAVISEGLGQ